MLNDHWESEDAFEDFLAGALAGVGGVTYMILMRQAHPQVLMGTEMMVIAAVVMGVIVMINPFSTVETLLRIAGVFLLVDSVADLVMVWRTTY